MIKTSEEFYYNGFSSKKFGVLNVNISNAELVEPLFGNRTLNEERLKYKDESYFHNIIEDGKTLTLELAFDFYNNVEMTNSALRGVKRWLGGRQGFKSLWFSEDCFLDDNGNYDITKPRRIYKATVVETSNVTHFGLQEGYVTVTFKCNSGYCYSPIMRGRIWNEIATDDPDNQPAIYFGNYADMPIKPQIQITVGQKDPDDETDDPHNQSIKIIGEQIEDNQKPPITIDGFQRDYPYTPTDYSKFPVFEFSGGKKATGFFQLLDTIFFGEKFYLGNNNVYEFDLGMGKPFNKSETENILVPINDGVKAHNTLRFNDNSDITDGSTVTIGSDQCFEYDWDTYVSPTNIRTDISEYVSNAKGILHLNSNPFPNTEFNVGDMNYTMIGSTTDEIIKMTDHMLTDGTEQNYIVRNNVKTLMASNVNINTQSPQDITQCLLLNTTKNNSDIGLRKLGYIDKDFCYLLWDGESSEDFNQQIDDVPTNGRFIVTFDTPVNEKTINNDTVELRNIEGNQIQCTFGISGNDGGKTVYVTPNITLDYDTDYFLYVSMGVKDLKGVSVGIKKIKFHTKTKNATGDESLKNVSIVKVLNVYSSQKIDSSTVTDSNIYVVKSGNSTHENVNINLIDNNKTISVFPKIKYEYNTSYELHVLTNIKDVDENSIILTEKVIKFTTQTGDNSNITNFDDGFKIMVNTPIDKAMKAVFENKLDPNYINNNLGVGSEVVLKDKDGNNIDVSIAISPVQDNILLVTPNKVLTYNSIYYLYVSQALRYYKGGNIQEPLYYKVITEVDPATTNNTDNLTVSEIGDKSLLQNDFSSAVNTDKTIVYNFKKALDTTTINTTNIWINGSKGNKVDIIIEPTTDESGVQIFPSPIWISGETYSVFINSQVKTTNKPRIFVGDATVDAQGNLGDFENAKNVFGTAFDIIKTNGFTIDGVNVKDTNGHIVVFTSDDIVITTDVLPASDYNPDGTIKSGTVLVSLPNRGIFTAEATPITGKDRVEKYKNMVDYFNKMKKSGWESQSLKPDNTLLLTFTVKDRNEHIAIDVDSSIILNNTSMQQKIIKKIVNQRPSDNVNLYHEVDKDFVTDLDMLIPNTIPQGAKVYAGKSTEQIQGLKDDFDNSVELLQPLGFDIVDLSTYTLADKKNIIWHEGDLCIGGILSGVKYDDFDPKTGNLLTTLPTDGRKERVSGIPLEINIYPAKRLEGSANDCGRAGTRKAIESWVSLYKKAQAGGTNITDSSNSNLARNGITAKYHVKEGSKVFATGYDYYSAIKYLSGFGYKFINIGLMSLAEKQALDFQEGDLVIGGIGASDATTIDGKTVTVTGIPAINIGNAKRIGGADRYETLRLVSEFASNLKVRTLQTGDIVRLKIKIDDAPINTTTTGTSTDDTIQSSTINNNIKVEYHRIKSIKELPRNRVFIEFEEDIRTIHYISEIQVTDLYKLYNQRVAEDICFTAPYQIRCGYDKAETILNIVKAINDTGTPGQTYSLRTFKHPIVLSQIANDNEIELDAIDPGTKGNIPVSLINKYDPLNRFLTPTLTGGKDCSQLDAIKALAKQILIQNDLPERYNKDQYTVEYDSNTLTVTHKMYGKKYNNIICLANITQQYQTPYIITNNGTGISNANLINLKDYLTREKQVAVWENGATLIGGTNPSIDKIIEALKTKIDSVALDKDGKKMFNLTYILGDDGVSRIGINIEYYKYGEEGNTVLNTTCTMGKLSGKQLRDGVDGLYVGEVIKMDCAKKRIESSLNKDRNKNFNGNWLEVPLDGVKLVTKKGCFQVSFRYQELYYI